MIVQECGRSSLFERGQATGNLALPFSYHDMHVPLWCPAGKRVNTKFLIILFEQTCTYRRTNLYLVVFLFPC